MTLCDTQISVILEEKREVFALEWLLAFDNAVLDGIQRFLRTPFGDFAMPLVTALGNAGIVWIALCLLLLCFHKTRRAGIAMALSLLATLAVCNLILKPLVGRIRPFEANGFVDLLIGPPGDPSFPSGHTAASFAAAAALWRYYRKAGAAAFALAVMIAFSRLYLYVHYPSDVLGGAAVGLAAAWAGSLLERRLHRRRENGKNVANM